MTAVTARFTSERVSTLGSKRRNQTELKYGERGPLKYAISVYSVWPAARRQGT